ncbi:MAG: motility associated factor glycosyltransferase family protein [Rhodospirillales bacterium]|nr:motility associated factor glycosyltransferase family protein [Rhodospirillales bacterium]
MTRVNPDLFQRNLDALRERHPEVAAKVDAVTETASNVVVKDGVAVNVDLGTGMLYPDPEPGWSMTQKKAFEDFPDRIGFSDPNHCNFSDITLKLHGDLVSYLRETGFSADLAPLPVVDVGYVFVFGIGLGYHLDGLIETTSARHVVLIEAVTEFLVHALGVQDWERLMCRAEQRGIRFHFVLAGEPELISNAIDTIVSREGNVFLEGSYYFPHYYSWTFREAFKHIKESIKSHYITSGFFEDEIEMVRNCAVNLRRRAMHVVETRPAREQVLPVFIVGAGPSLDNDLDVIRKWRDRVLVVSCGTVLGILLKNGIRPDIHCELERGEEVFQVLSPLRAAFGFEGMTLLATTTVHPTVTALFDKHWFFYRSGLSTATLLRGPVFPLLGVDPLVCNAAFAAVAELGFREIYLFGIDLAQKESGRHHAKDSVYFENAEWDEIYRKRFDRVVPGNFGGIVETCWNFDLGRQMLARVQARLQPKLFNCSDGARINGAKPRVGASIAIQDRLPGRDRVLARIEQQMRFFEKGEILAGIDFDQHIAGCDAFVTAFDAFLDAAAADDIGFFELEARLHAFIAEQSDAFRGFYTMARGSIVSMLRIGAFYGNRIADEDDRRAYIRHFIPCYRARCAEMAEIARAFLTAIRDDRETVADVPCVASAEISY